MLVLLVMALAIIAPTVFVYFLVIKGTDRYEPEPFWLLSVAFFWGAVVATVTAIVGNALGEGALALALRSAGPWPGAGPGARKLSRSTPVLESATGRTPIEEP